MTTTPPFGTPLPGPLRSLPAVGPAEVGEMLAHATRDLELGPVDQQWITWIASDWPQAAILASLLTRARQAGESQ